MAYLKLILFGSLDSILIGLSRTISSWAYDATSAGSGWCCPSVLGLLKHHIRPALEFLLHCFFPVLSMQTSESVRRGPKLFKVIMEFSLFWIIIQGFEIFL